MKSAPSDPTVSSVPPSASLQITSVSCSVMSRPAARMRNSEFGKRHRLELLDASETAVTSLMPGKPCHGIGKPLRKTAVEAALHVARVENHLEGFAIVFDPYARNVARKVHVGFPVGGLRRKAEYARFVVDDDLAEGTVPRPGYRDGDRGRRLRISAARSRCGRGARDSVPARRREPCRCARRRPARSRIQTAGSLRAPAPGRLRRPRPGHTFPDSAGSWPAAPPLRGCSPRRVRPDGAAGANRVPGQPPRVG